MIDMIFNLINVLFKYWISTEWYIALTLSFVVNALVYMVTAGFLSFLNGKLKAYGIVGTYIDNRPLKEGQIRKEIIYGIMACFVFSVTSLFTRSLFYNIWPESILSLAMQIIAFSIFYETYSYFIHRLLHTSLFIKVHSVHHRSVRVTPWSAYSVHPVEAVFIGISAPIFMYLFPMSLSTTLVLHVTGMIFTMLIHSNFMLDESIIFSKTINAYSKGHALHHQKGRVNYGFVNSFWDSLLKTHLNPK